MLNIIGHIRKHQLQKALKKAGNPWESGDTPVSRLPHKEQIKLCGVAGVDQSMFVSLPSVMDGGEDDDY